MMTNKEETSGPARPAPAQPGQNRRAAKKKRR